MARQPIRNHLRQADKARLDRLAGWSREITGNQRAETARFNIIVLHIFQIQFGISPICKILCRLAQGSARDWRLDRQYPPPTQ